MLSANTINKKIKGFFLLILLSSTYFLLNSCVNNPKDFPTVGKKQTSTEEGNQITIFYSEDAKVRAKLTSPYMLRHLTDSTYVEFPRTLHVDFYNDTMVIESKLDAHYGKYREFENKVFLRDSVVVRNILKGDTLHCDELWWDKTTQTFYTDKKVRINTKDKVIFGTGLQAAQNFTWYVIQHPVGSILTPQDSLPK